MSTKKSSTFAILFVGAVMIALSLFPARLSAQVLHLQAGTTTVDSAQATCDQAVLPTSNPGILMVVGCSAGRLTMVLQGNLSPSFSTHTVDASAYSRLVVQFQVDTQPGAPDVSFVPVVITVPVSWKGILGDSSLVPPDFGASVDSFADVNGQLYLATGQAGIPQNVGPTVATNNFLAATHSGVAGCLTVPKTAVAAALMIGKCGADGLKKEQGNGTIYIAGLIQTGQTYDAVVELDGHVFGHGGGVNGCTAAGCGVVDFQRTLFGDPDPSAGLFWSGSMTITIGTDFQSRIAGLQKEIGDLQNQLNMLRTEFLHHSHVYLTGKGIGQNNTKVNTGPPNF